MYAVIATGGKQYKVAVGDEIFIEKLTGEVGDEVSFEEVLLVSDEGSLKAGAEAADVKVTDMFISVNRCEVGQNPGKTAVMEVGEEFGIHVHSLIDVRDVHEYLQSQEQYKDILPLMESYMDKYCVF